MERDELAHRQRSPNQYERANKIWNSKYYRFRLYMSDVHTHPHTYTVLPKLTIFLEYETDLFDCFTCHITLKSFISYNMES